VDMPFALLLGGLKSGLCADQSASVLRSTRREWTWRMTPCCAVVYMRAYCYVFVTVLIFVSRYSNNEMCSNIWESRKLKANTFEQFLYCSIRKKKLTNTLRSKVKQNGLT
jgi:hypothetical protein